MEEHSKLEKFLKKHKKEYSKGRDNRNEALNFLKESYKFSVPYRAWIDQNSKVNESDSLRKSRDVFDSTLALAVSERVDMIKTDMFPIGDRWFNAQKISGEELSKEEKETVENILSTTFRKMNGSNLHMELKSIIEDFVISTAVWKIGVTDDIKNPLVYTSIPIQQVVLGSPNKFGRIQKVFWERPEQTYSELIDWLPTATMPEDFDEKDVGDITFKIIEFCVPSDIVEYTEQGVKIQYYEYYAVNESFTHIFYEDIMEYNPLVVSRCGKSNDGTRYGKGKVQVVLPNILTLNDLVEKQLEKAAIDANPPMAVILGGMVGKSAMAQNVQFRAGESTSLPQGSQIFPIQTGNDISTSIFTGDNIRKSAYDIFVTNPLGTPEESRYRTAEENVLRQQRANKRLASDYGTVMYEIATPLVENTILALASIGMFVLPEGFEALEMKYVNPMTDSQKMSEIEALISFVSLMRSIFGDMSPLMALNDTEVIKGLVERLNVKTKFVKDEGEMEQSIQQTMMSMQAQQLQAMQAATGGGGELQ